MCPAIYDPTQIQDNVLEGRSIAEPRAQIADIDDMVYATSPTVGYEVEGTFSVIAGRQGLIQFASGAVAGNRARLNTSVTALIVDPTKDFNLIYRALTSAVVQVSKFLGIFSALPTAAAPSVEPANGIYFRALDVAAAVNYFAVTRLASVETAVDTGVLDSAVVHDFKIEKRSGVVKFYIDGILKATITTNIPIVACLDGAVAVTQEAVAKNLQIDARSIWART